MSKNNQGYIAIKIKPDNPFYPMASATNYVFEHRLVVAQSLGRCLEPFEVVHHKNRIRHDNRLVNLELIGGPNAQHIHNSIVFAIQRIRQLEAYIDSLELEIKTLRWELAYSNSRSPDDTGD